MGEGGESKRDSGGSSAPGRHMGQQWRARWLSVAAVKLRRMEQSSTQRSRAAVAAANEARAGRCSGSDACRAQQGAGRLAGPHTSCLVRFGGAMRVSGLSGHRIKVDGNVFWKISIKLVKLVELSWTELASGSLSGDCENDTVSI